ncbi:response regulator [Flavobacterium frigidarium]|uniref:response regulator n=1 Tax=Flavobacterium frigidarium TaxID=99286 RepID=UPI00146E4966|nr:response regulator [Flavobacterium frigidarium]
MRFSKKALIATYMMMAYFTYAYILYGKFFNFTVLLYIIPVVLLIIIRYHKLVLYAILYVAITVPTIIYFDYFGYDLGGIYNYDRDIYNEFFYFTVIMIMIYLIVLLTARTNLVKYIIEDLKAKNIELEESRIKLKKLQINKESFFAIMSHEIRTPLNAIKGISDILKSNDHTDENKHLLELMDYSSNHLLALVNNILDFTKLNDGAFSLQYSSFDLNSALNSSFRMNERLAVEKGLVFNFVLKNTLPNKVYGDKNRINQIILNLLNNAIEHTEEGKIEMIVGGEYNPHDGQEFNLTIQISDTGSGISKELGTRLFQKYATTNSSTHSVGLGLTISKGLLDLMHGQIRFESEPNKGTSFFIDLPLPIVAENELESENSQSDFKLTTLNILIVDDNKINLMVLEKQLKNKLKNSTITSAYNGLEALNIAKDNDFDLILMDVLMPVMDGITATQHIRGLDNTNKKTVPIIALTANVGEKELFECSQAGMNDFVTKPFEINELLKVIQNSLVKI